MLTYKELVLETETELKAIQYFQLKNLLPEQQICDNKLCQKNPLVLKSIDKIWYWNCKKCKSSFKLTDDTIFENSHLSFREHIDLMYKWSRSFYKLNTDKHRYSSFDKCRYISASWAQFYREICMNYLYHNSTLLLGGENRHVEVYSAKLEKTKYVKMEFTQDMWVIGGIERFIETKEKEENPKDHAFFYIIVKDKPNLSSEIIINQLIKKEAHIYRNPEFLKNYFDSRDIDIREHKDQFIAEYIFKKVFEADPLDNLLNSIASHEFA